MAVSIHWLCPTSSVSEWDWGSGLKKKKKTVSGLWEKTPGNFLLCCDQIPSSSSTFRPQYFSVGKGNLCPLAKESALPWHLIWQSCWSCLCRVGVVCTLLYSGQEWTDQGHVSMACLEVRKSQGLAVFICWVGDIKMPILSVLDPNPAQFPLPHLQSSPCCCSAFPGFIQCLAKSRKIQVYAILSQWEVPKMSIMFFLK